MATERYSITVLKECISLQEAKGQDYQNVNSSVRQADYYPSGIKTIYEMMQQKMLRIKSLMESGSKANHESMGDSIKDLINYSSFMASYLEGKIDGQDPDHDVFNRPKDTSNDIYKTNF